METIYKFDIVQIFTSEIDLGGLTDQLVDKIEFSLIGYKEDQNTFLIDSVFIPKKSDAIIPYDQLSKPELLEWVKQFISDSKVEEMKAKIDSRLDEMIAHFAQFNNDVNYSKPTLPPWADNKVPEWADIIIPKIDLPK